MRRTILSLLLLLLLTMAGSVKAAPPPEPTGYGTGTASDVIANINQYRAANGLPTLSINSILMSTAQAQANYQASTGTVSHTGAGGTTPKDRAIAAGYGGGANIFLSEIIYGGMTATSDVAMEWWKNSSVHNTVMLTSTYSEIGAGVASNGTSTYFTAVLASVSGGTYTGSTGTTGTGDTAAAEAVAVAAPVVKADPKKDGSIVHVIQDGQALWTLAVVYGVALQTLLDLNDLPETALVFPGDKIIIRPANTPAPTVPVTATSLPSSTPVQLEQTLVTVQPTLLAAVVPEEQQPQAEQAQAPVVSENTVSPTVRWIVVIAFIVIFGVVVGSMFMQRLPQRPPDDDVVR